MRRFFNPVFVVLLLLAPPLTASIPLLFRAESLTCWASISAYRDWRLNAPRRERVRKLAQKHFDYPAENVPAQYQRLLRDRDLLPENGTLHLAGIGQDFYFPLVALATRPDIRVVISEPGYVQQELLRTALFEWAPTAFRVVQPRLFVFADMSLGTFSKMIRERIRLTTYAQNQVLDPAFGDYTPAKEKEPIPPADLTFIRYPNQYGPWNWDRVTDNGVVWTLTEFHEIETPRSPPHSQLPFGHGFDLFLMGYFSDVAQDPYRALRHKAKAYLMAKPLRSELSGAATRKEHLGPPLIDRWPNPGGPVVKTPATESEIRRLMQITEKNQ